MKCNWHILAHRDDKINRSNPSPTHSFLQYKIWKAHLTLPSFSPAPASAGGASFQPSSEAHSTRGWTCPPGPPLQEGPGHQPGLQEASSRRHTMRPRSTAGNQPQGTSPAKAALPSWPGQPASEGRPRSITPTVAPAAGGCAPQNRVFCWDSALTLLFAETGPTHTPSKVFTSPSLSKRTCVVSLMVHRPSRASHMHYLPSLCTTLLSAGRRAGVAFSCSIHSPWEATWRGRSGPPFKQRLLLLWPPAPSSPPRGLPQLQRRARLLHGSPWPNAVATPGPGRFCAVHDASNEWSVPPICVLQVLAGLAKTSQLCTCTAWRSCPPARLSPGFPFPGTGGQGPRPQPMWTTPQWAQGCKCFETLQVNP